MAYLYMSGRFIILLFVIFNVKALASMEEATLRITQLKSLHTNNEIGTNETRSKLAANIKPTTKTKSKLSVNKTDANSPCGALYIKTNGTTCGLKQIMIGRCYEYQYVKQSFLLTNNSITKNCTQIYEAFESAVRHKSYCNMNMETYKTYFELALSGVHIINRAMFWSGTYTVAHMYGSNGKNYITLEDTLGAALVNGLTWCGKENDTEGFDFVSCPYNYKGNQWADYAFWGLASKTFAQLAAGEIYIVLNGSHKNERPAFRNNSYFASFELPNLRQNGSYRVTKANVLLLHSPDEKIIERCGEKSLLDLEALIRTKGFDYSCTDDPEELILIMCSELWEARECQLARRVLRKTWEKKLYEISNGSRNLLCSTTFWLTILFNILFYL